MHRGSYSTLPYCKGNVEGVKTPNQVYLTQKFPIRVCDFCMKTTGKQAHLNEVQTGKVDSEQLNSGQIQVTIVEPKAKTFTAGFGRP